MNFFKFFLISIFRNLYKEHVFKIINRTSLNSLKDSRVLEPELFLLNSFISNEDIVFDIGANIGQYTYVFEKLVGSKNIYAFEPIDNLHNKLKIIFPKINLSNIALSKKGVFKSQFKIPVIGNGNFETRGKLDINIKEPGETDFKLFDVTCDSIDNFVDSKKIEKISFIKIDVEGHEFDVIKGGINSIIRFKPTLLIEIEQRHHDFDILEIFNYLSSYYSKIEFYDLSLNKFRSVEDFDVKIMQNYSNIKTKEYINNFWFYN